MQKLRLNHALVQRLSPQKIQLIKLLQVPSIAMKDRIEQELASNPALEEGPEADREGQEEVPQEQEEEGLATEYLSDDGYRQYSTSQDRDAQHWLENRAANIAHTHSLSEQLLRQLDFLSLDERQHKIGVQLIGSIESDGYIRRDLEAIVNDLAFTQYVETSVQEVAALLRKIQRFDPVGVGARSLQECLLVQLEKSEKNDATKTLAIQVLTRCFEAFTKKHYDKIHKKLGVEDTQLLKESLALIAKLDPRPGSKVNSSFHSEALYPDFIVTKRNNQLHVALTNYHLPTLRVRKNYAAMLEQAHQHPSKNERIKEATAFVKRKLEAAQWFIDAMKQRQYTLLNTMKAIVKLQHDFFMEEEERQLRPMVLKYVAEEIGMDVSTVSRIVNNKSVQTDFGVYPLKFFFTEAISTTSGEDVSNRAVKKAIADLIKDENKQRPYADEKITVLLKEQGYPIARRTVAKYREQLGLPVARLRKEL
ncbi:MAG: RNA polymerase factor sigma-54 [Roseivirga sp.]